MFGPLSWPVLQAVAALRESPSLLPKTIQAWMGVSNARLLFSEHVSPQNRGAAHTKLGIPRTSGDPQLIPHRPLLPEALSLPKH